MRYMPVRPAAFREFLGYLPIDREHYVFVDYGSGRGRALMLAAEAGFRRAIGVELDPCHHAIAAANVARHRSRDRIDVIRGDARDVDLPPEPVVIFIYNPFPRGVMETVVRRIGGQTPSGWLIYEATEDRDLLDGQSWLRLVAERRERAGGSPRRPRFAIYEFVWPSPALVAAEQHREDSNL